MELLLALVVIALAATGMAVGVLFGRGPVLTSCGAAACLPKTRCEDCPMRNRVDGDAAQ